MRNQVLYPHMHNFPYNPGPIMYHGKLAMFSDILRFFYTISLSITRIIIQLLCITDPRTHNGAFPHLICVCVSQMQIGKKTINP
jgi:hypothetical protein